MLISSLRDVIRTQATEMDMLQAQLKDLTASSSVQVRLVLPLPRACPCPLVIIVMGHEICLVFLLHATYILTLTHTSTILCIPLTDEISYPDSFETSTHGLLISRVRWRR